MPISNNCSIHFPKLLHNSFLVRLHEFLEGTHLILHFVYVLLHLLLKYLRLFQFVTPVPRDKAEFRFHCVDVIVDWIKFASHKLSPVSLLLDYLARSLVKYFSKMVHFASNWVILLSDGSWLHYKHVLKVHLEIHLFQDESEIVQDVNFLIHSWLLLLTLNFVKCVGHYCNQHIEECDLQREREYEEDHPK